MRSDAFDGWVRREQRAVEDALEAWVPADSPAGLGEAMRYGVLDGGKRLRPLLVLAAAEAVGHADVEQARQAALPAACAVEMIHTYSLIHDDLPAMDDDALRRGRPTSHVVHGEGLAILAGDGLQAEAFALLARLPDSVDPEVMRRKLLTLQLIAEAAGAAGMVGGQAIDLAADPTRPRPDGTATVRLDADNITDMHARKTGALIRASVLAGAIMAGAEDRTVSALDRYARSIGLAFQIVDDILDVEGVSTNLGKTTGKDAAAGKPTYVSLYGLEDARDRASTCIFHAHAALESAGATGSPLTAIADWVVQRHA
jgi:geranylgeranyl pyrophosphate synthase